MDNFFTIMLQISGVGLLVSGFFTMNWVKIAAGCALLVSSPWAGQWLVHRADPRVAESEQYHAERKARKAAEKEHRDGREQIGFEYFKATFLFAGHIASADGVICENERQVFEEICLRLNLDKAQKQAAYDYFSEGSHSHFDSSEALNRFSRYCGEIEVLCDNFLRTQFSFAEASGNVVFAELRVLELISQRLNAKPIYQSLLEEYRLAAAEEAEILAQQRADALKRERDKRREAKEKSRIEEEEKEKLSKLTPAQRELRLAFAVLGIKATKDKAAIKRAYREQIKRHHPDYLLSQGYPDELLQEATERSVKINKAYRLLKKTLKFT